jgi:hypothetical protein
MSYYHLVSNTTSRRRYQEIVVQSKHHNMAEAFFSLTVLFPKKMLDINEVGVAPPWLETQKNVFRRYCSSSNARLLVCPVPFGLKSCYRSRWGLVATLLTIYAMDCHGKMPWVIWAMVIPPWESIQIICFSKSPSWRIDDHPLIWVYVCLYNPINFWPWRIWSSKTVCLTNGIMTFAKKPITRVWQGVWALGKTHSILRYDVSWFYHTFVGATPILLMCSPRMI